MQKSVVFLYISNDQSKKKLKKIHLQAHLAEHFEINFTKAENFFPENYKILLK